MAREQDELKAHIKEEEKGLKQNFEEIKDRVKDAVDVSVWYRKNTALALGGAAAGGLFLSLLLSRGNDSTPRHFASDLDAEGFPLEDQPRVSRRPGRGSHFREIVDNSVTAALGVAEDRLQDFLSDLIPGYREHYGRSGREDLS